MRAPRWFTTVFSICTAASIAAACSSEPSDEPSPKAQGHGGGGAGGATTTAASSVSETAASGSASSGGAGGDNGMPSDVYPAFHPTLPTITSEGGPVVAYPNIYPVYFANDDPALMSQVTDFVNAIGHTEYWSAVTKEYEVNTANGQPPVQSTESPSGTITDLDIKNWLSEKLNSQDPAFPVANNDTIFLLMYPPGVTVSIDGRQGCSNFGAYHESVKLDAAHDGLPVAYAVVPHCSSFNGLSGIDEITAAASHELVEAATDPWPSTEPAFSGADMDHVVWGILSGTEVCDFCDQSPSSYGPVAGFDQVVERCWSNQAAAALHDPCVPANPSKPYFNSAAVLPDVLSVSGAMFHGVKIPVGETREIEVDLFSEAATAGPWNINAVDMAPMFGMKPELSLALDKTSGLNGEKVHLTITAMKKSASQFSLAILESQLGTQTAAWFVPVMN